MVVQVALVSGRGGGGSGAAHGSSAMSVEDDVLLARFDLPLLPSNVRLAADGAAFRQLKLAVAGSMNSPP